MQGFRRVAVLTAVTLGAGFGAFGPAPAATASGRLVRRACDRPAPGHAACFALVAPAGAPPAPVAHDGALTAAAKAKVVKVAGFHPADLVSAYKLDPTQGTGQTVAVVDAFDDPKAETDLAAYRSQFGLPACTTANSCFKKVNQAGAAAPLPTTNSGWAVEISLDLDMVSAVCPHCKILLVEAQTNAFADLAAAENQAATLGATVISNSYGGAEFAGENALAASYDHPGIPITVSAGDQTYSAGAEVPAAFGTVTAVGGTSLHRLSTGRRWKEAVWLTSTTAPNQEGTGSGCSAFVAKPAWQHDTACAGRTIGDVSAVADPATGVAVRDSYGEAGWLVVGGTSASAPIIAGVYALAGNGATIDDASFAYAHPGSLFDVVKGKNGFCKSSLVCTAKKGYDGPTGLGTPNGTGAF